MKLLSVLKKIYNIVEFIYIFCLVVSVLDTYADFYEFKPFGGVFINFFQENIFYNIISLQMILIISLIDMVRLSIVLGLLILHRAKLRDLFLSLFPIIFYISYVIWIALIY